MKTLQLSLLLLTCFYQCSIIASVEQESTGSERPLLPNGKNVCSFKETRHVQVNTSFIDRRTIPVTVRYKTSFWGITVYRTRIVMREHTSVRYFMQTKLREFDVYYCCDGWTNADNSKECTIPVCSIGCDNGGDCTAPDTCTCKPGFEGMFCQNDVNECDDSFKNNCEHDCLNTRGSFQCYCRSGYKKHPEDPTKCIDVNECEAKPCTCPPGDTNCNVSCTNTMGSFKCQCSKGYDLFPDGTCRDINECIEDVCNQICVNLPGSYYCKCLPGYEMNNITGYCVDINECETDNGGCNQKCHNVEGDYACSCDENYYLSEDRKTCKVIEKSIRFLRLCTDGLENFAPLSCWPSKISLISAFYGRTNTSICNDSSESTTLCSVDGVFELLAKKCDGKHSCFLDASKEALAVLKDQCPNTGKYLELTYTCIVEAMKEHMF